MDEFRDLAKNYPNLKSALVNLSSPQFKFYEKVFGDMGGGDVDNFRNKQHVSSNIWSIEFNGFIELQRQVLGSRRQSRNIEEKIT